MRTSLLIIVFFICGVLSAQNSNDLLCKVLDAEANYPVAYATVRFENVQNGVIAGEDGGFRLPLDYKTQNKAVIISSIGYKTLRLEANTLKENEINIIYLKPRVEELGEVLITAKSNSGRTRSESAETIIRNAIGRIPTNYPYTPHSYITYYRDYQVVNNNYYNLNEAIIENFDAGFNTDKYENESNKSALYSYDLNTEFYQDKQLLNSIYGKSKLLDRYNSAKLGTNIQNELEILNIHNPIRNFDKSSFSFIYVFKDNFIENHDFKLMKVVYADDIPLYEIRFVSKGDEGAKYIGQGTIYISKTNYAIHKLEYRMLDKGRNSNRGNPFGNSASRITTNRKTTLFEVNIEYKAIGEKMYLNYMTFNNRFIIKEPNPFKVEDFYFNTRNKKFYITFNKPIDEKTIKRKSNFRLRYDNTKLIINSIELEDEKILKIDVIGWSAGSGVDTENIRSEDFSYKLKRVKDISGAVINKESKLIGYQFRELFTQEVFKTKQPEDDLIFLYKTEPLFSSRINNTKLDVDTYWINTPLKQTKG
ncbi:carboxypeptidase-like regulatory domain-containing protein [Winogradskyella sp.]|uniref:carboxypeptidase-like regulatory domain-containing protein n=1 Tax=Winogradskyella sp. TaxID=1883156 RepID=UPI003F6C0AC7